MSTKKKIILTILLAVLVAIGVYCLIINVLYIKRVFDEINTMKDFYSESIEKFYAYKNQCWVDFIIPHIIFIGFIIITTILNIKKIIFFFKK